MRVLHRCFKLIYIYGRYYSKKTKEQVQMEGIDQKV